MTTLSVRDIVGKRNVTIWGIHYPSGMNSAPSCISRNTFPIREQPSAEYGAWEHKHSRRNVYTFLEQNRTSSSKGQPFSRSLESVASSAMIKPLGCSGSWSSNIQEQMRQFAQKQSLDTISSEKQSPRCRQKSRRDVFWSDRRKVLKAHVVPEYTCLCEHHNTDHSIAVDYGVPSQL